MKFPAVAFVAIALTTTAFTHKSSPLSTPGFTIDCTIEGYPDYTVLYLVNRSGDNSEILDSAAIVAKHLKFKGTFKGKTLYASIQTKTLTDYKFLWLENRAMTFKAVKGKFRSAIITGSQTQADDDRLNAQTDPLFEKTRILGRRLDSVSQEQQIILKKQIDSIHRVRREIDRQFIKSYPSSVISASLLNTYASTYGKEVTAELYKALLPELKASFYGKTILKYLTLNKKLQVGDKYVDFSANNPGGKSIKISQYAGRVFLIDFWASWCIPCRKQNPILVKTYNTYKSKGFEVIGVSIDAANAKTQWIDAIKKDGLPWENISELKGDKCNAALIYGISGIPDNFLIDKNGTIVARNLRGQELDDKLARLLK